MNGRIKALLYQYDDVLAEYTVHRTPDMAGAEPNALGHLRWMIGLMLDEGEQWSDRKANRWLGFIQGTMWALGLVGIKKLRDQSRHLYD